jgi:O-antigen/teichoic acid export membrane protein
MNLLKNISWAFIGNSIYLGSQWMLLLLIGRLGSPEMLGQYVFGLSIVAPTISVAQMQLTQIQVSDFKGEYALADYIYLRLLLNILAFGLVLGLGFFAAWSVTSFVALILLLVAKLIESMGEVAFGSLQAGEKFDALARLQALRGALGLLAAWLGLVFESDLHLVFLLFMLASAFSFGAWEWPVLSPFLRENHHFDREKIKKLLRLGFPFGLSNGLNTVAANVSRYFIAYHWNDKALGLFSAAAAPANWLLVVPNALNQAITPRAARLFQEKNWTAYLKLCLGATALVFLIQAFFYGLCWLAGDELMRLLFGIKYQGQGPLLQLFALNGLIAALSTVGSLSVLISRSSGLALLNTVLSLLILLFFNWLWTPSRGAWGAANAELLRTIFSAVLFLGATIWILKKHKSKA